MTTDQKDPPDMLIYSAHEDAKDNAKDMIEALALLGPKIDAAVEAVNEIFTPLWLCAEEVDAGIWNMTCIPEDVMIPEDAAETRKERAEMTVEKAQAAHLDTLRCVTVHLKEVDDQVKKALGSLTDRYDLSEEEEWPPNRD